MMRKTSTIIMLIMLIGFVFSGFNQIIICKVSGITIYVDDDGTANYTTIQDAIEAASSGDTINVYNGTYYENIEVYTSIDLIGENPENTIIDGSNGYGDVMEISAHTVKVIGFTIQNSGEGYGIVLRGSNNSIISGNIIKNTHDGIGLSLSSNFFSSNNNTLSENRIIDCDGNGIFLSKSCNNNIIRNTVANSNWSGINMPYSNYNNIVNNTLTNTNVGIGIMASSNNSITGNTITHNDVGILIGVLEMYPNSENNNIYDNTFSDNNEDIRDETSSDSTSGNDDESTGTPGFEFLLVILTIAMFLFLKKRNIK